MSELLEKMEDADVERKRKEDDGVKTQQVGDEEKRYDDEGKK
jgi:hypothetical protein